jgi:dihydrofolate reductase
MLSLIVAMTPDRVIGSGGDLPWRLSADLQRFKRITMGHTMIMGRKTFESIGRPLPGRTSIVVTRQRDYAPPGVLVAGGLSEAIEQARGDSEVFVIGGSQMYDLALPYADRLYVTRVESDIEGDTFFPEYDQGDWRLVDSSPQFEPDDRNEFPHRFEVYERVPHEN